MSSRAAGAAPDDDVAAGERARWAGLTDRERTVLILKRKREKALGRMYDAEAMTNTWRHEVKQLDAQLDEATA